jgi:hypothetical protein
VRLFNSQITDAILKPLRHPESSTTSLSSGKTRPSVKQKNLSFCKLPSAGEQRMSEGRGFLIAFHGAGQCCFKGGERNYSSDAPSRREDRYCVGDIPKEALNNRLKWAESLKPHL